MSPALIHIKIFTTIEYFFKEILLYNVVDLYQSFDVDLISALDWADFYGDILLQEFLLFCIW